MTTLLEKLLSVIAPHSCLGCGAEGNVVCPACCAALVDERLRRCHVCAAANEHFAACPACRPQSALSALYVLGGHDGLLREVVARLKFGGARQAAADVAPSLAALLPKPAPGTAVVHVPTAHRRVRQRGFDQAALLARGLSRELGLPHRTLLRRSGHSRQVGAGHAERREQARAMFRLLAAPGVPNIVLIDDVVTTGASLEAAARVLRRAGAQRIYGVALARPLETSTQAWYNSADAAHSRKGVRAV